MTDLEQIIDDWTGDTILWAEVAGPDTWAHNMLGIKPDDYPAGQRFPVLRNESGSRAVLTPDGILYLYPNSNDIWDADCDVDCLASQFDIAVGQSRHDRGSTGCID